MNLRLDSKLFIALSSISSVYYLYEFYNPGYNTGGQTIYYNSNNYTSASINIDKPSNTFLSSNKSTYEMRKDLNMLNLKVAFVVSYFC